MQRRVTRSSINRLASLLKVMGKLEDGLRLPLQSLKQQHRGSLEATLRDAGLLD